MSQTKLTQYNFTACIKPQEEKKDLPLTDCTKFPYATDKLVFKHDTIECFVDHMNNLSIIAGDSIPQGTLLCVEEGWIGSTCHLANILTYRLDVAEELWPRDQLDFYDKVRSNTWEFLDEEAPLSLQKKHALFPFASKFNHSCQPNAHVMTCNLALYSDCYTAGICVYAVKDIYNGQEVCVNYGYDVGHCDDSVFNWNCECGLNKKTRKRIMRETWEYVEACYKEDKEMIDMLCYEKTKIPI
jgi:SET domain-containing protein